MNSHPQSEVPLKTHSLLPFPKQKLVLENEDSIRVPGFIQAHGILLVLQKASYKILRISDNTTQILGINPEELLGNPIRTLLDSSQVAALEAFVTENNERVLNPLPFGLVSRISKVKIEFDGVIHCEGENIFLELEPKTLVKTANYLDFYNIVRGAIARFKKASTWQVLCNAITQEMRQITGCDRATLYKFDPEGNGRVIAEDKQENLTSFLGLNYPALDIPESARNLLLSNPLRAIADIEMPSARILPDLQPLDLSSSVLRGVSPCHIEYLRNMGVRASLSVSIINNKRLWGLVVCHNTGPKYIPYEVRVACELVCQMASAELATKEDRRDYQYRLKLASIQSKLLAAMTDSGQFKEALIARKQDFLALVSAGGAALCLGNDLTLLGNTPPPSLVKCLLEDLGDKPFYKNVFYTNCLRRWDPIADRCKEVASGLLALAIAPQQNKYILWFRPELIQTVCWAGDPAPQTKIDSDGIPALCPRKSFELWKEKVQFTSVAWQQCEIEAARELRRAIINVVLRQADELAELNAALQQSEAQERERAQQLKEALNELQQTQTQLIHNEKMSGLGQLVAGVAHELNNPINFIAGNLTYAREYADNLLSLVELYARHYPSPPGEVRAKAEEIELDFLMDDMPKLLTSMKVGAERISKLVYSLRNFSRLDESDMKPVDLHEGIDNTLVILNSRLKARHENPGIKIIKEYGNLPLVECHASQLNQVFMNLIANGIDAIEERDRERSLAELEIDPGAIAIRTEMLGEDKVAISIRDNALGMPESVRAKIFDPFFTTKPVGKGTGLGLAISYQIVVEKHQGQLLCFSTPRAGTEFRIEIPLKAAID